MKASKSQRGIESHATQLVFQTGLKPKLQGQKARSRGDLGASNPSAHFMHEHVFCTDMFLLAHCDLQLTFGLFCMKNQVKRVTSAKRITLHRKLELSVLQNQPLRN